MKQAIPVKNLVFPAIYNWFLFVPLITFFLSFAMRATGSGVYVVTLNCVGFAALIFLYITQIRFLRQAYPKKILRPQLFLPLLAFVAPTVADFLGDIVGKQHYGTASNSLGSNLGVGVVVGTILTIVLIYSFAIGNLLYIRSGGMSSLLTKFSRFMYGVGILLVMVISFFIYNLIYSLHDPSTE